MSSHGDQHALDNEIIDFYMLTWPGYCQPAYGHRPGRKPAWYWTVNGPRAAAFLCEIEPYLRTSRVRNKAALGMEFRALQETYESGMDLGPYKAEQEALYMQMKRLNRRGVVSEAAG